MSGEAFWRAPRRLRCLLEDGEIPPTAFALVAYLGLAGADRDDGLATTYGALAAALDVSTKTVKRSLERLRSLEAVEYELAQGQRTPFRIRLGPAALVAAARPRTPLRTRRGGPVAEVVSQVTSDTGSAADAPDAALEHGSGASATSDTSRARAETETETENYLDAAVKGRPAATADLPDELAAILERLELAARSHFDDDQRREALAAWQENAAGVARCAQEAVTDGRKPIGLFLRKLRRGDHLLTANGSRRPTREEQLERARAWIERHGYRFDEDGARTILESDFKLDGAELDELLNARRELVAARVEEPA